MKKLLIYGSREFGNVVKSIAYDCEYAFAGFIDDYYTGPDILGPYELIRSTHSPDYYDIAMAVGYSHLLKRWDLYERIKRDGYSLATLIHPQSYCHETAKVEEGAIIMTRSVIDMNADIKEISVVWPGVVVNHDSSVGPNCFISPNATICGYTVVESGSFIGAGSIIIDHSLVKKGSFIKAGTVYR